MVLSTKVNIINDSSERIKIKIDNDRDKKFDEIINIEPGARYNDIIGYDPGRGRWDLVIGIIKNPAGPNNNERYGTFRFDNPAFAAPYVESDDFTTLSTQIEAEPGKPITFLTPIKYTLSNIFNRYDHSLLKTYWGKLDKARVEDIPARRPIDQYAIFEELNASLIKSAPFPRFTIEAFVPDVGYKTWDLRINSDSGDI
jgi:hypothetical protein